MFGKNKLLSLWVLLSGNGFSTKILCMPKMKEFMLQTFENILNLLQSIVHLDFKKVVEFIMIFHILSHSCLMFDFEIIKELFCVLKVENNF